ncbi:MAG: hypothetical protein RLZZ126_770 [Pseudomonadota bacterium]|jgi:tRNA-modifying protein YgfZ
MIIQRMSNASPDTGPTAGLALPQLGVIRAQGADATSFLQGQLTQDVALMPVGQTALAAWCSAKGRILASFWVHKLAADDYFLVTSRDILEPTRKRMAMFVLRAKVQLTDVSASMPVWGVVAPALATPAGIVALSLPPVQGEARALWVGPHDGAMQGLQALAPEAWQHLDVMSGVAHITQPVVEAFVPQMLNYESVGGVNFKKGCYPGQEVVARSQFRGTLKRRAYLVEGSAPMDAGQEVFSALDANQPCGTVVQAAAASHGAWVAIASMQVAAAESALQLGRAGGPPLRLLPLPYALRDDI